MAHSSPKSNSEPTVLDAAPSAVVRRDAVPTGRSRAGGRPGPVTHFTEIQDPQDCESIGFRGGNRVHSGSLPVPASHVVLPDQPTYARPVDKTVPATLPTSTQRASAALALVQNDQGKASKQRPPGQWLIGLLFCGAVMAAGLSVWNALFRYEAFGVVTGRIVEVAPEWEGILTSVQVRDGGHVKQGQPLYTIVNDELEQQLDVLEADLRTAIAALDADIYEVRWQAQLKSASDHFAASEYHKRIADLEAARTQHQRLRADLKRMRKLEQRNPRAVRTADLESLEIQVAGNLDSVQALTDSVTQLKPQEKLDADQRTFFSFKAKRAHIDSLTIKIEQLRERLSRGVVRAPVAGHVLERRRQTGEFVAKGESVVELVEEDSIAVDVFLTEDMAGEFNIGDEMTLEFNSTGQSLRCTVSKKAERLTEPPASIERHYRDHEQLVRMTVEPPSHVDVRQEFVLGAVVRVPVRLSQFNPFSQTNSFSQSMGIDD